MNQLSAQQLLLEYRGTRTRLPPLEVGYYYSLTPQAGPIRWYFVFSFVDRCLAWATRLGSPSTTNCHSPRD